MGLFGKLLLFVNLLAAGGFAYLVLEDYKGRQTIAAAGLRHQMLIDGFPFTGGPDVIPARVASSADGYDDFTTQEIPFEIAGPGNVKTKTVSPELLYVYFAPAGDGAGNPLAGSTPVASQMAEVKRVWGIIKALLEKADGNGAKAPLAFNWLIYQAETIEERSEYIAFQANAGELMHALDLKFYRVSPELVKGGPLNPDLWGSLDKRISDLTAERDAAIKAADEAKAAGNTAEEEKKRGEAGVSLTSKIERRRLNPPKDNPDRQTRLARHLLVHLDQAAVWQKRVAMILGLKTYAKAVDAQAGRFKTMLDRVDVATVDDQERFVGHYAQLRTLAIQRTQLVIEMAELKAQLTAQAQKDQDLVNQRKIQLTDLTAERNKLKAEVDILLAKQTLVEKKLFDVEREIGLTLEDVYKLEAELKSRERLRYEQKKDR